MAKGNSLISVVMPAYNAERFVAAALESVLAQTYTSFEVLVVDDGSTDGTAAIVQTFADRDRRVRLIHQANGGVAAARNRAIEQAQGDFIAPLDADDIWLPGYLEQLAAALADPAVGMAYAWSVFIDEAGQLMKTCQSGLWQGHDVIPLIYRNLPGNASCVLIRCSCLGQVGGYDPSYRALAAQGCEDWDLYLRLAERYGVGVVPRLLVGYRQVVGSMSSDPAPMGRGVDLILERLAQRHPEIDPAIYRWNRSNFAWYLAQKCSRAGNHRQALVYLGRSLELDWFPLLRLDFYRMAAATALKLAVAPVAQQLWPDHQSWLRWRECWYARGRSLNPFYRAPRLEVLQRRAVAAKGRFPWWHYEKFVAWRCDRIRRRAQGYRATLPRPAPPVSATGSARPLD